MSVLAATGLLLTLVFQAAPSQASSPISLDRSPPAALADVRDGPRVDAHHRVHVAGIQDTIVQSQYSALEFADTQAELYALGYDPTQNYFEDPAVRVRPRGVPAGPSIPPPRPWVLRDGYTHCTRQQMFPISGQFVGYNPDDLPSYRPIRWAKVVVWSVGGMDSFGDGHAIIAGEGLTDERGRFRFDACHQAYPHDHDNPATLVVQVAFQSSALEISRFKLLGLVPPSFRTYVYNGITGQFVHAPGRSAMDIGTWSNRFPWEDPARNFVHAALIYSWESGIMRGWTFLANEVGYEPEPVTVHYLHPYGAPVGEDFPHYHVRGSPCAFTGNWGVDVCGGVWTQVYHQIHLNDAHAARSPDILLHLYGHFIMQDVYMRRGFAGPNGLHYPVSTSQCLSGTDPRGCYGDNPGWHLQGPGHTPTPDSPRYWLYNGNRVRETFDPGTAWAEGFADFFATWVSPPGTFVDTFGWEPKDGRFSFTHPKISPGGAYSHNFERRLDSSTPGSVEWNVAAATYDTVDLLMDGRDQLGLLRFKAFWDAFQSGFAGSITEFWALFKAYHAGSTSTVRTAKAAFVENGFPVNAPPALSDLRVVPVSPSGWYGGTVGIVVSLADSDPEDAGWLDVEFAYWQTDHWVRLGTASYVRPGPVSITWDTSGLADGNRLLRARASDWIDEREAQISINLDNSATRAVLAEPLHGRWHSTSRPTFRWTYSGSGAPFDHADLTICRDAACTSIRRHETGLLGTQWIWPSGDAVLEDGVFYWFVSASDTAGNVAKSDVWQLKVDVNAPQITLRDPSAGFEGNWNRPLLSWAAQDAPGSGVREVRIRVCEDALETVCPLATTLPAFRATYQWGSAGERPLADRQWWWSIEAADTAGNIRKVSADFRNTPPQPFALLAPTGNDIGWCSVTLRWDPSPDRSWWFYKKYYSLPTEDWTFAGQAYDTSGTISRLRTGTTYRFQVASVDDIQATYMAGPVSATTQPKPSGYVPTPPSLTVTSSGVSSIRLSWSHYTQCDFASYDLYRALGHADFVPDDGPDGNRIYSTGQQDEISYSDRSLNGCYDYTYKLTVKTVNGDEATSQPVYASTLCVGRFSGSVLYPDGRPATRVQITVRDHATGQIVWSGPTKDGFYESGDFSTQKKYDLTASKPEVCWAETRRSVLPGRFDFTIVAECI